MKNIKFSAKTIIMALLLVTSVLISLSACTSSGNTTTPATTSPTTTSPVSSPPVTTISPSPSPSVTPPSTPSGTPSVSPSGSPVSFTINVSSKTGIGNYLVNGNGMTLYYFAKDVNGQSNATGAILQTWPIFNATSISVPSTLSTSDFGSITRSDGLTQTTYKGWPLYNFANDKAPGDTKGDGFNGFWFLVKIPFYTVMLESRTDLGTFLVDPRGMTLYYNNADTIGQSNQGGSIISIWPIFNASSFIVPSTLQQSDFGTITRSDGQKQATYKGFPLYFYANDKVSGDATGNGLSGVWFVINITNFPPTPSPTPATGGGGY